MTFLNAALLFGAAALSIPIIIHLLNRSRFRVVQWGAMHLLAPVVRTNRKRIQIEQIILLMIRALIPLLLAILMAVPVLTHMNVFVDFIIVPVLVLLCIGAASLAASAAWRWGLGAVAAVGLAYIVASCFGWTLVDDKPISTLARDAKTSMAVVLDNSYSMEAGSADSNALHDAKQAGDQVIARLPRGSEVAVRLAAGGVVSSAHSATVNLSGAAGDVTKLEGGYGSSRMADTLDEASAALASMKHAAKRELIVVSDFQKIDWAGDNAAALARVAETIEQIKPTPSVTLFRVGQPVKNNVAVLSVDVSRRIVGVGQQVTLRGNLQNFGDTSYPDQRVHLHVNGVLEDTKEVSLPAGQDAQVLFQYEFVKPGSHVLNVSVETDALKADNKFTLVVPVWDKLPVLLVDGDPRSEPLQSETSYLQIALRPFGLAKEKLTDLIETKTVPVSAFDAASLTGRRVVVLANVAKLTAAQVEMLKTYVSEGNAAMVFLGNQVDAGWYNAAMHESGKGLLPTRLSDVVGAGATWDDASAILEQRYNDPALELFNDPRNGSLADGKVRTWYKLDESDASAPGVSVTARLDTGDALLVEKKIGRGRVLLCATTCDDLWTTLPVKPVYVPLMQRLVTHLAAGSDPPRNLSVGEPIVAFVPRSAVGRRAAVLTPAGERHEVEVRKRGLRGVVQWDDTDRPGVYTIEAPKSEPIHFAVMSERDESDLTLLSDDELEETARTLGASVVESWEAYRTLDSERRHGRSIRWEVFAVVLALLFGELFFQQWFSRRRA